MTKVKLYTGTQHNQSINLWGEVVSFDTDGIAEVSEEIAKKAATGIPADYSLEPARRRTPKVSSYSFEKSGDGVGKRAASVVEKEHSARLEAQKKAEEVKDNFDSVTAEEPKADKGKKKSKKKSAKKSESKTETTAGTPPNDENPKDSNSEEGKSGDIWK